MQKIMDITLYKEDIRIQYLNIKNMYKKHNTMEFISEINKLMTRFYYENNLTKKCLMKFDNLREFVKDFYDTELKAENALELGMSDIKSEIKDYIMSFVRIQETLNEYDLTIDCVNNPYCTFEHNGKELEMPSFYSIFVEVDGVYTIRDGKSDILISLMKFDHIKMTQLLHTRDETLAQFIQFLREHKMTRAKLSMYFYSMGKDVTYIESFQSLLSNIQYLRENNTDEKRAVDIALHSYQEYFQYERQDGVYSLIDSAEGIPTMDIISGIFSGRIVGSNVYCYMTKEDANYANASYAIVKENAHMMSNRHYRSLCDIACLHKTGSGLCGKILCLIRALEKKY